jgi:hypothetical protein
VHFFWSYIDDNCVVRSHRTVGVDIPSPCKGLVVVMVKLELGLQIVLQACPITLKSLG